MGRYLAIDLGTSKVAALVFDTTGDVVAAKSVRRDPVSKGSSNRSESDADATIDFALREVARPVVQEAGYGNEINGIGVTGQMHGMVLVNQNPPYATGSNFIDWRDQRCEEPIEEFGNSTIEYMRSLLRGLPNRTGCRLATGYMGSTLFWLKHRTALLNGDVFATFLPDLLVARLCGSRPVTDHTNAGGSGVFDVVDRAWDLDLLERLELSTTYLPEVVRPGTRAGFLDHAIADTLGLRRGLPVYASIGDNQASFAGSVKNPESDLLVNIGTGGQISAYSDSYVDPSTFDVRCAANGGYLLVGTELTGGSAYSMLHRFVADIGTRCFNSTLSDDDLYAVLASLAATAPSGSAGVTCNPRFKGTRSDAGVRGSFTGIGEDTFGIAHITRALLEGLSANFRELFSDMPREIRESRRRIVGSGNAIRRNSLLVESLASDFGFPDQFVMPRHQEEAAVGAALLAAVSTGELSWEQARELL